jgi:hypothetical protein
MWGERLNGPVALTTSCRAAHPAADSPEPGPYPVARPRIQGECPAVRDRTVGRFCARGGSMSASPVPYRLFVGIDIAAASASVACATDPRTVAPAFTIAQTSAGFATLVSRLQRRDVPAAATLVVLEATNTSWLSLALHLHDTGFAVSVINPAQAHQLAKALLKRAKTDAIDAHAAQRAPGLNWPRRSNRSHGLLPRRSTKSCASVCSSARTCCAH